jgi:hypothetical protein
MRGYEIAAGCSAVLGVALGVTIELMRRDVHSARYGNQQIGRWDTRFVNNFLGRYGLWSLHKQLFPQSHLRRAFLTLLIAFAACLVIVAYTYLAARPS